MNEHRYLRAYMAGSIVPTMFLLVAMCVFTVARYRCHLPIPIERVIVFPLALLPNLWGAWNVVYEWLWRNRKAPIGLHGAALVFVIVPTVLGLAKILDFDFFIRPLELIGPAVALVVYYLVWKYLVSFFNRIVGLS